MENNQEHKIDKIFRETFENHEITPPSDAWTGIHTYTIGQKEKKPKIWLRYVSLATLLLLISGFGMWYFVDNQVIADVNTPVSLSQEVVSGDTRSNRKTQIAALQNVGRTLNPVSVKTSNQLVRVSIDSFSSEINHLMQDLNSHDALIKTSTIENKPLIIVDSLSNHSNELAESLSYSTDNKLEIIEPKPLIFDNLSGEIQKKNENKIMALEENMVDKKAVFKADSVDYGSKFSLRHPIITYGFGQIWNFWDMGEYKNNKVIFPNERGSNIRIGIAWKMNKKTRAGLAFESNGYNLGTAGISLPGSSSSLEIPTIKLIRQNQVYRSELPFGNIDIPISYFQDAPVRVPNQLDTVRRIFFSPQSMRTMSGCINFKYDFFSKFKEKEKKYSYQIYVLSDLVIQRQTSYSFVARDFYSGTSSLRPLNTINVVFYDTNHLQNASEFVFGLRAGLGFRYQFARKWDFYIESSGQHSWNNWVKSDDIKTFQRALSVQAGINLNL